MMHAFRILYVCFKYVFSTHCLCVCYYKQLDGGNLQNRFSMWPTVGVFLKFKGCSLLSWNTGGVYTLESVFKLKTNKGSF